MINTKFFRYDSTLVPVRLSIAAALALAATGCAFDTARDEPVAEPVAVAPEPVEPSPSDPFAAVDEVFARLAIERQDARAAESSAAQIWPRLIGQFRFGACSDGTSAARWAQWYADNPDYMRRVFNRARPWLHDIVNEVEQRGMPGEFALLPVVESAFDPFAYSHGRAAGPWQFLSGTARDYGLEINDWYDGRRDFVAATDAALDYLVDLAAMFDGDWALALAAYNAGQGRVRRAIRRNAARGQGTTWDELRLPRETRGYVPKMQGLSCLFRNPARYGFALPTVFDRPEVETVELPHPVDLAGLSLEAGLEPAELITLNAGLNRHRTPPSGPHYVVVPRVAAGHVREALDRLDPLPPPALREVRVQRGDTLSGLASRHRVSIDELRRLNGIRGSLLVAGQRLKLPGAPGSPEPAPGDARYREAYRQFAALQQQLLPTDRFIHRVRSGESLWLIARRYGVTVGELQRMNGLGPRTLIRPGQRLVIETDREPAPPKLVNGRYVVRQGDSLWIISRRQQVDLQAVMRWNGLNSDSVLRPGQELVIRRQGDA